MISLLTGESLISNSAVTICGVGAVEVAAILPNLIDNPAAIAAAISFGRRVVEEELSDEWAIAGPHLLIFPLIENQNSQATSRSAEKERGGDGELMLCFWSEEISFQLQMNLRLTNQVRDVVVVTKRS